MIEIKTQLEMMEQEKKQVEVQLISVDRTTMEYTLRIEQAEKMCAELVVFDPADVASVRGDYHITTLTHLWRPAELLPSKQSWIFDDTIQVSFTQQGNLYFPSTRLYSPEVEGHYETIVKGKRWNNSNLDILMEVGLQVVEEMLEVFDKHHQYVTDVTLMKQVFYDIASFWESVKTIYGDMKKSESAMSDRVEWKSGSQMGLKCCFFSALERRHVSCFFEMGSVNGVPLYPFGQVKCTLDVGYGNVEYVLDNVAPKQLKKV
jgi:hypothetical protein